MVTQDKMASRNSTKQAQWRSTELQSDDLKRLCFEGQGKQKRNK